MTDSPTTGRAEQQTARRTSLSEALRRYRQRRTGYEQMRSGDAPKGLYRPQRNIRHDYRA